MTPAGELRRILSAEIRRRFDDLFALYRDLHRNPELSGMEERTAAIVADRLGRAGFYTTEGVGGFGVVGRLENKEGPAILVRADMDALPLREETGLPYASTITGTAHTGEVLPVMHACGHDLHTAVLIGCAEILAGMKEAWEGTLLVVAQPAEEALGGAHRMMTGGLYTRFPVPDAALALHVKGELPAGAVGLRSGRISNGAQALDIVVNGVGGHAARPHHTHDPVVLAARIILAIQTILSREVDPATPAVATVGAVHGGTKRNIIPETVTMNLTIRSSDADAVKRITDAVSRTARYEALAAGFPETGLPAVTKPEPFYPPVVNSAALHTHLEALFTDLLGPENVLEMPQMMGSEDFSEFAGEAGEVPIYFFGLGATREDRLAAAAAGKETVSPAHTSTFSPDAEPTLKTGLTAMSAALISLLRRR
jgi:hippurate hydrolase